MQRSIELDCSNMFAVDAGMPEKIKGVGEKTGQAVKRIAEKRSKGGLGFYQLPFQTKEKEDVKKLAGHIRNNFENLVVVGIGGSALGNRLLHGALNHRYYNMLAAEERNGCPRVFVLESIDPESLQGLMDILELKDTVFNVITKSGTTSETMANFLILRDRLERELGKGRTKRHIIATTDRDRGSLLGIAKQEGYGMLNIPADVGGRYSVLSPVGLLSAAVSGIDIDELLAGAAHMERLCAGGDPFKNPALMGAVIQYLSYMKGRTISVMMPYSDALEQFGEWYCQLWAESLGKTMETDSGRLGIGQTPLKAVGVRDQHSLLQLFLDGPDDKVFTLITVEKRTGFFDIPSIENPDKGIGYLSGKTLQKLLDSEFQATETVLTNRGRLNYRITVPEIRAYSIGQLIFLYMLMTAYMGELLGVNAFDQPAVEEGKRITYRLMGREGY